MFYIIYCTESLKFVNSRNATAEWLLLDIRELTAPRLYDVGYAEEILGISQHFRKCNITLYFKMSCVYCCSCLVCIVVVVLCVLL